MAALPLLLDTAACPHGWQSCGTWRLPLPNVPRMRRCLPGTFDEAVTRSSLGPQSRAPVPSLSARADPCRPGSSPPSRLSPPWPSPANVAFGKAFAAAIPVHIFVLYRFAVASLALAPMARSEAGPALARMNLG